MPHTSQTSELNNHERPACLKCGAPMRLIKVENETIDYERRTFECAICNGAMTEWAATSTRAARVQRH